MGVEDYFKSGKIKIWKEKFAVIKSKHPIADSFAVINDKNEITAVIDQSKIEENSNNIINIEKDWKILTFDMILPFGLVGFLAKISKILADENISIFVISSYSTDHILIKEKNLNRALEKLSELGFIVNR